ncbi:hypothetical protein [Octadecabacter arcticus]|nr:hypothetical protein [Octadecabacter arcticus]
MKNFTTAGAILFMTRASQPQAVLTVQAKALALFLKTATTQS